MGQPIYNVLFIDIETAPIFETYQLLPVTLKKYWDKKEQYHFENHEKEGLNYQHAGLFAEFSKVICISIGVVYHHEGADHIRIKSFYDQEENLILEALSQLLDDKFKSTDYYICAHNGKAFDFPFLSRRMVINNVKIPNILLIHGRKPWELSYIDTMDLWRFGDYKHTISLELLSNLLGIISDFKSEMSGDKVFDVYHQEKNLEKIKYYCEKDLWALINCYRRLIGLGVI